ncbi:hypothetical protein GCM10010458_36660 [Microbacterium luteolum]
MLTVDQILTASDNGTILEVAQAEAERVKREIWELWVHRQTIIENTVKRLRDGGVDAHLARILQAKSPTSGVLCESWSFDKRGTYRHGFDYFSVDEKSRRKPGVHLCEGALIVWHGTYELLHRDGQRAIVVSAEGVDDHEAAHRRDVAHLRRVARRDGLSVSVRDRDVTLLDPMGTTLHTGTVITTLAFIAGIDLNAPVEEIRA